MLTNVSTLRVFTSFYFSTQTTTWISQLGEQLHSNLIVKANTLLRHHIPGAFTFMGYISVAFAVVSTGIPLLFIFGKPIRAWTSGKVNKKRANKWNDAQE